MAGQAEIDPATLARYLHQLETLSESVDDLSTVWPELGAWWQQRQQSVFDSNGKGKWAPLASTTLLRKQSTGGGAKPMIRDHTLMADLTSATPRNSGTHFAVFGPTNQKAITEGEWGIRGTSSRPQRNPVPKLTPSERKQIAEKLLEFIMKQVNGT